MKNFLKVFLTSVLFLMVVTGVVSCVNRYLGLKDDNFIEEAIEAVIEEKTGIDVDLTPHE